MKKLYVALFLIICVGVFYSCKAQTPAPTKDAVIGNEVQISLSDEKITANGKEVGTDEASALFHANDIVYYQAGKDFTYGEGSEKDAHEKDEADAHTVLHITRAGIYRLKGNLSRGQIAVDLGEDAKEDPEAVVTLILDGVDLTCTVAPAVIFYNVYECGSTDAEKATKDVDTSAAGANVILADGSQNTVNGSYVERIYKADSVVLNEEKNAVEDAKKLHKYDGAFYSRMSMNIDAEEKGSGVLDIFAENEGLGSELHLTVNGGQINIRSGNDGINTNEDGISVTTISGGKLHIRVTGETGEGDGIDSNGWLVINGGSVTAQACSTSGDAGIDADMGIHINGGTVVASGNMLDRIENGGQTYAVFNFAQKQKGGEKVKLKNEKGNIVFEAKPENSYSILILSSPHIPAGTYTLWSDEVQLMGQSGGMMGGGMRPDGDVPQMPGGEKQPQMQEGQTPPPKPDESRPQGQKPFEDSNNPFQDLKPNGEDPRQDFVPEDGEKPEKPDGQFPEGSFGGEGEQTATPSTQFIIREGGNTFIGVSPAN